MKSAIIELEIALHTAENNEPINRREGNIEQADLQAKRASELRQALAVLRAAVNGPIWPGPGVEPQADPAGPHANPSLN